MHKIFRDFETQTRPSVKDTSPDLILVNTNIPGRRFRCFDGRSE